MAFGSLFVHLALLFAFGSVLGNVYAIEYTATCPFVDLCIKNVSKTAEISTDVSHCCPLCYCDSMCVDFSDCCPDVNVTLLPVTNMVPSECLTSVFPSEYSNENESFPESRKYFQKRNCSELFLSNNSISNRHEIKEKCEGNVAFETFDDIVMVSNLHRHEEVFSNKYCAECNGVSETVRWDIKIHSCRVDLLSDKADLGPLLEVLLNDCHVESIPPPDLQFTDRIRCSEPVNNKTCNPVHVYNMAGLEEDTNSTCDNATLDYEFVSHDAEDTDEVYEKYKCYVCINSADQIAEEICMDNTVKDDLDLTIILGEIDLISGWMPPSVPNQNKNTSTRETLVDSPEVLATRTPITFSPGLNSSLDLGLRCSFDELYLKEVDLCVKITCPSYTVLVNKQCIPIANSMIGMPIQIRILYRYPTLSRVDFPHGTEFENYIKSLAETIGVRDISMYVIVIEKYYKKISRDFECMIVGFLPVTSLEHPVTTIIAKAAGLLEKDIHLNMTIRGREYFLHGKMDFRTSYDFRNGSYSVSTANFIFRKTTNTLSPILDGLYICPHVIFNVDQYCFYRQLLLKTVCPNQITEFNVMSEVEKGFYVLSPNTFGICTDTLQQLLGSIEPKETVFKDTFINEESQAEQTNSPMQYYNTCVSNMCYSKIVFVVLLFLFYLL